MCAIIPDSTFSKLKGIMDERVMLESIYKKMIVIIINFIFNSVFLRRSLVMSHLKFIVLVSP